MGVTAITRVMARSDVTLRGGDDSTVFVSRSLVTHTHRCQVPVTLVPTDGTHPLVLVLSVNRQVNIYTIIQYVRSKVYLQVKITVISKVYKMFELDKTIQS